MKNTFPILGEHKVCGRECLKKWVFKNRLLPRRICNECLKPYIPTAKGEMCFCSKKCQTKYHKIAELRNEQRKLEIHAHAQT